MPQRPSNNFLGQYFEKWRTGLTTAAIAKALGVKVSYLNQHVAYLHEYCRTRISKVTRSDLVDGSTTNQLALTPEWRTQFLASLENGLTIEETAGVLGVPLPTVTQFWFRDNLDFKTECDYARQRADLEVMAAVRRSAIGYTLPHTEQIEEEVDAETGTTTRRRTLQTNKHFPGNASAQKLWLVNRRGWVTDNPGTSPNLDDTQVEYDVRKSLYEEDEDARAEVA